MRENKSDKPHQLTKIPLFSGLSENAVELLERILVFKQFSRGDNIFSEGDESAGFYIITRGRVKVYKLSPDGKEQILHIVGVKELLGAVSAFAGTPYPAYADSMEKTSSYFFPRRDVMEVVKKEPSVVMNMMANLSMRLQHFTRMIENLSLKEVPGRLASYFLYMCTQKGCTDSIVIDIPKGQLASLLGTIPETLSRILRKMSDKKIIRIKGKVITLLDKKALNDLISGEKLIRNRF